MNSKVKYEVISAKKENINLLKEYKLNTIFEFANSLKKEEIIKIKNYVNNSVPNLIENYKLILISNIIVGCILFYKKDDGILLDEIFIEEKYRNNGVGTNILKTILKNNNIVYLWVYKLNTNAIKLYKKLGFKINYETETRYYMEYKRR